MFIPVTGESYTKTRITIHGSSFTYLGSTLTHYVSLDVEIHLRIQKVSVAYGMLQKRVCSYSKFINKTKTKFYWYCLLIFFLYLS